MATLSELTSIVPELDIPVDYSDEDLIIIDNVRHVAPEVEQARLQMNIMAVCTAGRVRFDLSGHPLELSSGQILLCPPGTFLSGFLFSADSEFKIILFTTRLLQSFLREKMGVWNQTLYVHKLRVLTLTAEDVSFLQSFYSMLRLFIDSPKEETPYRADIIRALLRAGVLGLCGRIALITDSAGTGGTLFQRFLDLLTATEAKHRPLAYYAQSLFVTPKYLSAVCKRTTGKTAADWITEYTLEDIRHYLCATDMPIKQICDRLGFPNPSFFGRYVREHFGRSPRQLHSERA